VVKQPQFVALECTLIAVDMLAAYRCNSFKINILMKRPEFAQDGWGEPRKETGFPS
jgi:hypothetical protein